MPTRGVNEISSNLQNQLTSSILSVYVVCDCAMVSEIVLVHHCYRVINEAP